LKPWDGDVKTGGTSPAIYISGKMSGLEDWGAKEFNAFAAKYRELGFTVVSPIELDHGDHSGTYSDYIRRDVSVLLGPNIARIYMLPSWRDSRGATFEKHLAEVVGIPVYDAETGELLKENVAQEAMRLVFGDRSVTYSNPLSDFGRTKDIANALFKGKLKEDFTEEDIALFMIGVKLSRLVNKPDHRDSLVDIVGYSVCYEWLEQLRKEAKIAGTP
jgi:hypothetical protein